MLGAGPAYKPRALLVVHQIRSRHPLYPGCHTLASNPAADFVPGFCIVVALILCIFTKVMSLYSWGAETLCSLLIALSLLRTPCHEKSIPRTRESGRNKPFLYDFIPQSVKPHLDAKTHRAYIAWVNLNLSSICKILGGAVANGPKCTATNKMGNGFWLICCIKMWKGRCMIGDNITMQDNRRRLQRIIIV